MIRVTQFSDSHGKHDLIQSKYSGKNDLPGGNLLLVAGDISNVGRTGEIYQFLEWFDEINNYDEKIFIAGNHDFGFEKFRPEIDNDIAEKFPSVKYLMDNSVIVNVDGHDVKIYGSPWQPEFYNWAFNLPRGKALEEKWELIPEDTDILITHGPPYGILDKVFGKDENLGCGDLRRRVEIVKPKIHLFGHIHSGNGYLNTVNTHFFNVSALNEKYFYTYKPVTFDWDFEKNEIKII